MRRRTNVDYECRHSTAQHRADSLCKMRTEDNLQAGRLMVNQLTAIQAYYLPNNLVLKVDLI